MIQLVKRDIPTIGVHLTAVQYLNTPAVSACRQKADVNLPSSGTDVRTAEGYVLTGRDVHRRITCSSLIHPATSQGQVHI